MEPINSDYCKLNQLNKNNIYMYLDWSAVWSSQILLDIITAYLTSFCIYIPDEIQFYYQWIEQQSSNFLSVIFVFRQENC